MKEQEKSWIVGITGFLWVLAIFGMLILSLAPDRGPYSRAQISPRLAALSAGGALEEWVADALLVGPIFVWLTWLALRNAFSKSFYRTKGLLDGAFLWLMLMITLTMRAELHFVSLVYNMWNNNLTRFSGQVGRPFPVKGAALGVEEHFVNTLTPWQRIHLMPLAQWFTEGEHYVACLRYGVIWGSIYFVVLMILLYIAKTFFRFLRKRY